MLNPLFDHLIVEAVDPREAATASGIIIPDTAQGEKPQQGRVTAAGPGKMLDNGQRATMSVKVGDTIVFKKYAPDEVKVEGKEYLVISESDVLAIVTK
jgi:chaperonin GroES